MKVKKSEIQLLIAVIGVLIVVCTYFLVYSSFNEKSDALEAQNAGLNTQVKTLEELDQKKEEYLAATEKARDYITSFENRYAADILPEDSIMMVKTLEDATRTEVASIAFGTDSEVIYTETTADTTANATAPADDAAAAADAALSANTVDNTTTSTGPVSTEGTTYADTHLYEVPLSISIQCTYNDFKGLVRYIYNLQERKCIHSVSLGYNSENGMLSGSMNLSSYYLTGTDKTYSEPDISGVGLGVDTIFGNVD